MDGYLIEKFTGPDDLYRAKNFVERVLAFFPNSVILSESQTRVNANKPDCRIGRRHVRLKIPENSDNLESTIDINEQVYDLPKRVKNWGGRDNWGGEERAFTKITVEETSGHSFHKRPLREILGNGRFRGVS